MLAEFVARHDDDRVAAIMDETVHEAGGQRDVLSLRLQSNPCSVPNGDGQGEAGGPTLLEPIGSAPGYRRPVIVLESDPLNRSRIATVVCVVLTANRR